MSARRPIRHDEVPDADALEQAMPADARDTGAAEPGGDGHDGYDEYDNDPVPALDELPAEVPEADALEQATPATVADDYDEWDERDG
jgi:hypothetical protein